MIGFAVVAAFAAADIFVFAVAVREGFVAAALVWSCPPVSVVVVVVVVVVVAAALAVAVVVAAVVGVAVFVVVLVVASGPSFYSSSPPCLDPGWFSSPHQRASSPKLPRASAAATLAKPSFRRMDRIEL